MPLPGSGRITVNTNGTVPLANTGSGAPGTVQGSERSYLQALQSAIGTIVSNILNLVYTRQLFVRPTADSSPQQIVQCLNAGNTTVNWSITQGGLFSGTAAAANALVTGTTDGDKLHGIGTVLTARSTAGSLIGSGGWNVLGISLGVGTWLVTAHISFDNGASSGGSASGSSTRVQIDAGSVTYTTEFCKVLANNSYYWATPLGPVIVPGNQTVYLDAFLTANMVLEADSTGSKTWLQAVRVA